MKDYFFNDFLVVHSIRFLAFDGRGMSIHKLFWLFLYWLLNLSLYLFVQSIILCLDFFLFCIRIDVAAFDCRGWPSYRIFNLLESIFEETSNFIHSFLGLVWQTFFLLRYIWFLISFLRLNLLLLFEWILILYWLFLLLVICLLLSLSLSRWLISLLKVSIILNILLYCSIFSNNHLMFPCPRFFLLNFCLHLQCEKLVNELPTSFFLFLLAKHWFLFGQVTPTSYRIRCLFFSLSSIFLSTLPFLLTFFAIIILFYLISENFGWIVSLIILMYFVRSLRTFRLFNWLICWLA